MAVPDEVLRRVKSIEADRSSGAHALAAQAAGALTLAAQTAPDSIAEVASRLIAAQPSMAPMVNLARAATAAKDVPAACRDFLDRMDRAAARVASIAAGLIQDGVTVMTHSSSATVLSAFRAAREGGRRFSVIATESRPLLEGARMAQNLAGMGIPVTLIIDAAIYRFLPRAQVVFVGADSISAQGLVNKAGTSLMALAASTLGIPVYALCGREKFLPASYELPPEPAKDPREILEVEVPNVRAENYYFDCTPLEYLTGVVTEDGVARPSDLVF